MVGGKVGAGRGGGGDVRGLGWAGGWRDGGREFSFGRDFGGGGENWPPLPADCRLPPAKPFRVWPPVLPF